jgi:hypothetical protein
MEKAKVGDKGWDANGVAWLFFGSGGEDVPVNI